MIRYLAIDDDPLAAPRLQAVIQKALRDRASDLEITVIPAYTLAEGLEFIGRIHASERESVAATSLDLYMPGSTIEEAIAAIPRLIEPVFVVSGYGAQESFSPGLTLSDACVQAGATLYCQKGSPEYHNIWIPALAAAALQVAKRLTAQLSPDLP